MTRDLGGVVAKHVSPGRFSSDGSLRHRCMWAMGLICRIFPQALLIAAREPATFKFVAIGTTIMVSAFWAWRRLRPPGTYFRSLTKYQVFFDCPHTLPRMGDAEDWLGDHMPPSNSMPTHGFKDRFMALTEAVYESTNDVSRSNLLAATSTFNGVKSSTLDTVCSWIKSNLLIAFRFHAFAPGRFPKQH